MASKCTPTGVEAFFGPGEIIVSKTDTSGRITYANGVFIRISGYAERELLGMPHSLIRHPDMPRCVFKLLWDTISAGSEIFAYVVNLAKNGSHYWVLAHVTPTFGPGGQIISYHSSRRVPARRAIAAVEPIYAALRAEEARHGSKAAAVEAGARMLGQVLAEQHVSYDEFVWTLTNSCEEAA